MAAITLGPTRASVTHRVRPAANFDATVRGICWGLLLGGLSVITWWWLDGGAQAQITSGLAAALTSVGRVAGLWASYLLLIQVLLMARIPIVERAFGQERLTSGHRLVGFTSFNLILAHIALIVWGYAGGQLGQTPGQLWDLSVNYPGMLLAVAGTVALVMVVVTSVKAARRRLRYESWHLMHLYAYLGVGLALPHQLWTGADFLGAPGATAFWWGLWGSSVGAVLLWRVLVPLLRSASAGLRVTSVVTEGDDSVSVYLSGPGVHRLRAQAGQWFTWRFLGRQGWTRGNPYSLSAAPDGRSLRITAKNLGDGSRSLARLKPGSRVLVDGPYGRLSARVRTRRKVLFIGSGVGITPLRSLAEGLAYAPGEATVLYRYASEALFVREWRALEAERGLRVGLLPGHRRTPGSWLPTGVGNLGDALTLMSWVPDVAEHDVFVCGPDPWTELVIGSLEAAGVPQDQIHSESFGW